MSERKIILDLCGGTGATLAKEIEDLSRKLHSIYQQEAFRQSQTGEDTVRHPDDYDKLAEHTKDYDRALARFIFEYTAQQVREAESRVWEEAARMLTDAIVLNDANCNPRSLLDEFRRRSRAQENKE